ncbi:CHAT domain-containing protein [Nocardiopsis sp. FIRDI 009]|uniref:CHAT domain-containing protein n=1 Tax=Nocardiopsis sp. FIRDI 009 TaxID=714197 RepID=UPI001E615E36|nr:CHAT domain-containing protein [Nocardiopsis sp. FIRDI 009]
MTSTTHRPDPPSGRHLLARVRRGVRLARSGRFETTADLLADTHRRLRGHPLAEDAPVLPGVLVNLGLAQTMCGRFDQAEDHLAEAHTLTRERGLPLLGMVVRHNQGCLALYRGDTVTAIDTFLALLPRLPTARREALHVDLAEALLSEGLVAEAAATLDEGPCVEDGSASATALLVEAKLRFLEGDRQRAGELTRRVRGTFGPGSLWYRLASRLERIALAPAPPTRTGPHAPTGASPGSNPVGRARNALRVRIPLAAPAATHRVRSAPQRALDVLARGAAPAPGPWLGAAAHDPHVVRAGLEAALLTGTAATALEWAELTRAWAAVHVPGPHEPAVPALAGLAGRYRAALARGRGPRADQRARSWEAARWRVCRTSAGARTAPPVPAPVTAELLDRLGDERAFVHLTWAGHDAVALVAVAGRVHARPLGPLSPAVRALARFTHALPTPPCRVRAAAARDAAAEVSRLLLAPVLPLVGDRPLVMAVDPRLGDPPWGMLPALCGRPVDLVPTARFWVERTGRTRPTAERVLLVAAPAPDGARREVTALARVYPGARVLAGRGARLAEVLTGFANADVVHLAGHGHVPDRVPLLASVDLADGPLLARDLTGLTAAPALVTLSTCWNGRGFGGVTGTPSGFVGALHARGVRTVVASPVPVRDAETEEAMVRFHRALAVGVPASEAVAVHLGPAGFCCFGA